LVDGLVEDNECDGVALNTIELHGVPIEFFEYVARGLLSKEADVVSIASDAIIVSIQSFLSDSILRGSSSVVNVIDVTSFNLEKMIDCSIVVGHPILMLTEVWL
jgi:hypothetical protein